MNHYLRLEAINLSNFTQDTQDLSTIRGGGLLLLHAIDAVRDAFSLEPISTGASSGLFALNLPMQLRDGSQVDTPECLARKILEHLGKDKRWHYATFTASIVLADPPDYVRCRETLLALNRWQQWQQPTMVFPDLNTDVSLPVCNEDKIRPVGTGDKGEALTVSSSVAVRQKYGKEQKHDFYRLQMDKYFGEAYRRREDDENSEEDDNLLDHLTKKHFGFVNDFESLTHEPRRQNLHHKMAVIYLDGNRFGKIQEECCETPETHHEFDALMKRGRASALHDILQRMMSHRSYQTGQKELRIETLMWGGDELVWVVPAWKGWTVLGAFYQAFLIPEFSSFEGRSLTHAAGMVFCHHNAPIHRIVDLARNLAQSVKDQLPTAVPLVSKISDVQTPSEQDPVPNLPTSNRFQYLVLESFDHIGQSLSTFRKKQCPSISWSPTLNGEKMLEVGHTFRSLKEQFPRNKVFDAVHAAWAELRNSPTASSGEEEPGTSRVSQFNSRLEQLLPSEVYHEMGKLQVYFGPPPALWLHVADLWDYIPEEAL